MAQKKAHEVDRWIANPDPAIRMVLIYGPHQGLVAEQSAKYAASTGIPADDPFAIQKMEGGEIAGDPGRLIDELQSVPMFGGKRLVWVRAASAAAREIAAALEVLASALPVESYLLVEAGDLKKGAQLRTAFENCPSAMALPCYADDGRALDRVLDESLASAALTISLEARQLFKNLISGDRLAARAEIDKLILYCLDHERIEIGDVLVSAGDVSTQSLETISDLVLIGKAQEFDRVFQRAIFSGTQPYAILASLLRQLQQLQLLRHKMERDRLDAKSVVAASRPPIFFARRDLVTSLLSSLDSGTIARMLERVQDAIRSTRMNATIAVAGTHRVLLSMALEAERLKRQTR